MSSTVVWITGASSGIGAALKRSVPFEGARTIGVSPRAGPGEDLSLDLAEPAAWRSLALHFESVMHSGAQRAVLLHFAGTPGPSACMTEAALDQYTQAVLLNSAAGQVLGKAFLSIASRNGLDATVVLCSSPAAAVSLPGMSCYGSGKAAAEYWVGSVAAEGGGTLFAVVPFAVDTPMLREVMEQPDDVQPLAATFREAAASGELATSDATAAEIWEAVLAGVPNGSVVPVGAVPASDLQPEAV